MDKSAAKPPCLYPLPDGRRCCECDACQGTSAAYALDSELDVLIERYTRAIEGAASEDLARLLSRARDYILSARDYTRSAAQHEALTYYAEGRYADGGEIAREALGG